VAVLGLKLSHGNFEWELTALVMGPPEVVQDRLKRLRPLFDGWTTSAVIGAAGSAARVT
jgi:hypothetical protein